MEEEKVDNKIKDKKKYSIYAKTTTFVICALLLIAIILTAYVRYRYLNIISVGEEYKLVFDVNAKNINKIFGISFISIFIYVYILNIINKIGIKKFFKEDGIKMPKLPNKSIALLLAMLGGLMAIIMLADNYLVFSNAAVFGQNDPVFNNDISFYMFVYPFIDSIIYYIGTILFLSIIYIAFYYLLICNTYLDGVNIETLKKNTVVKELFVVIILLALLISVYIFISSQNILTGDMVKISDENRTHLTGAGLTDSTVKVWGYRIFSVIFFIVVVRLLQCTKKADFKNGMITVLCVPIYLIGFGIVMLYFQTIHVGTNEFDSEQDYIAYNIKYTKTAYGIDIDQENIENYEQLSTQDLQEYQELLSNIPIISTDIIRTSILEHQENISYYNYENTFLAYYKINNVNKLLYLTPREILADSLVTYNKKTYINTHGYSMVANSVLDSDNDGYSEYILSDFSSEGILNIKEPRIYFGKETTSPVLINNNLNKEFDYPLTASTNAEYVYQGNAGIHANFIDRLIVGLSKGTFKMAFTVKTNENTKLIMNRDILSRAETILPNVVFDENPYMVIREDGTLVWVVDGYTISNLYPYSQMSTVIVKNDERKINYIRNSVKVIIDAYDGTTKFYITDKTDPIILTYRNIYPGIFVEDEIPQDIKEHLVYPKFLFSIQAKMMNLYHDISKDSLYRADDIWQISNKPSTSNSVVVGEEMVPYYTVLKTKEQTKPELGIMVTYKKAGKQTISSYAVGRIVDGKSKLALYKFNSENNVVGMIQLNNQIEQDTTISKELEDLNTTGTKLVKDMIIVPIDNSLLYVEPIYQVMLNESEIPVLKKVIVASGTTIAIGDTLKNALNNLVTGDYSIDFEIINTDDLQGLIDSVIKANNNLTNSLNANNFELIGKDIMNLQNVIEQLKNYTETEKMKKEESENNLRDVLEDSNKILNEATNALNQINN